MSGGIDGVSLGAWEFLLSERTALSHVHRSIILRYLSRHYRNHIQIRPMLSSLVGPLSISLIAKDPSYKPRHCQGPSNSTLTNHLYQAYTFINHACPCPCPPYTHTHPHPHPHTQPSLHNPAKQPPTKQCPTPSKTETCSSQAEDGTYSLLPTRPRANSRNTAASAP